MTDNREHPIEGKVKFIQHNLPGLEAGEYQFTVSQRVSQEQQHYANQYHFAVQAPRFSLDPNDIQAVYPPDQTQGEYTDTLAHVVFTKQTLPWQRRPSLAEPPVAFPDQQHDMDVPTWLAVLIFDEDDEIAYRQQGFSASPSAGRLRDLFFRRPPGQGAQGYSYFYAAAGLDSSSDASQLERYLDYGQHADDPCNYLDIPLELFWRVAPSLDDLKMMAHVRNVQITRKATVNGVPASRNDLSKVPGTSNFAIVTGCRLPQTAKRCIAHLVSLEALEPFLPIDPATSDDASQVRWPDSVSLPSEPAFPIARDGFMRLAVLTSWSFTSTGTGKRFEQLLLELNPKQAASSVGGVGNFALGLPVAAAQAGEPEATRQARNALEMGYTALGHHTRDAGNTVSWYRGPLTPYRIMTNTVPPTWTSADAASGYDPNTGMFDISYAAAWQVGQLLALQDKHFAVMLYNWRRNNLRDVAAQMETAMLQQSLHEIQQQVRHDTLVQPMLKSFLPASEARLAAASLGQARVERAGTQRDVLADPELLLAVKAPTLEVPAEIYGWLARLKLLDGVPFNYLVADERMLPPESIRFFYLDENWVQSLLDGALSIGRAVTGNNAAPSVVHDVAVKASVDRRATRQASVSRREALGLQAATEKQQMDVISGFLLRSDVVQGWPGLEVNAYTPDGKAMDIVRFERLAPGVLLCLFELDGQPLGSVDIHEPAEGLHFGVTDSQPKAINLRYNYTNAAHTAGDQVPDVFQPVPWRDAPQARQLRLYRLSRNLHGPQYADYIQGIYSGFDHLPSSEFALQMVKGVGLVSFNVSPGTPA
ncbi:hypothetical protein [Pseudomonas carassii]|uniref:Uncharacterized protein n=1 Tax=Pseudomonas carassii TaxID=3115855 RepID=A0ABU7HBF1_9PSED|nr:hypothetical protein [Pseudomonas sp. 137P]MEE1888643.1 hypothetical protein [Pseudomonas sp. 137P]